MCVYFLLMFIITPNSPFLCVSFLCFLFHLCSKPVEFVGCNCSQTVPIPVPTQIQNYQRMEQNLQPVGLHGSTRHVQPLGCLISAPTPPQCLVITHSLLPLSDFVSCHSGSHSVVLAAAGKAPHNVEAVELLVRDLSSTPQGWQPEELDHSSPPR